MERQGKTILQAFGLIVVVSMLFGALPASASLVPKAVSWEDYASGLEHAKSLDPATVSQEARSLSVRDYALLLGAKQREVTPPPTGSPAYPRLLPLDEHPITDAPAAQAQANPAPDSKTIAPLMPSNPPKTTYDRLVSGAPMPTAASFDDTGKASPKTGGRLKSSDGWLDVQFPAGAVTQAVTLTYKTRGFSPHPLIQGRDTYFSFGLKATAAASVGVTKFDVPLTITITYPANVYVSPNADVFYWDEDAATWVRELSNHDPEKRTIVLHPSHLTDYSISDANQIQPNLPNLSGFQTDLFTGASTVNIPLDVPGGPGGLAPQLSLSYSSQDKAANAGQYDQASEIGWGWGLDGIPYIIKTPRVVQINPTESTLTYVNTLVLGGRSLELVKTELANDTYRTLDDSITKAALYPGATDHNSYWIVTTKDGTQYRLEDPWATSSPYTRNYVDVGSYCQAYDWRYSATSITDPAGNTITIDYTRETGSTDCRGTQTVTTAIHPDSIAWAGGKYKVKFNLAQDRADYYSSQQQATKRINEIVVEDWATGSARQIRKYSLISDTLQTSLGGTYYNRTVLKGIEKVGTSGSISITTDFAYTQPLYDPYGDGLGEQTILLHQADNGFGGTTRYDYESVPDSPDVFATWQMRVITSTEMDGRGASYAHAYSYGNSYVNSSTYSEEAASDPSYTSQFLHRPAAQYWGHDVVTTTDPLGNKSVHWFNISDSLKGTESEFRQAGPSLSSSLYITRTTSYYDESMDVTSFNSPFHYVKQYWTAPYVVASRSFDDTDSSGPYKETKVAYAYDSYGNVVQATDYGDTAVSGDEKTAVTSYYIPSTKWMYDRVDTVEVRAGIGILGDLLSQSKSYYDNDQVGQASALTKGLLTKQKSWVDAGHTVSTGYGYDSYGNQTVITDTRGYATTIGYDTAYHMYPVKVTNALGHEAQTQYTFPLGLPSVITDANANLTRFEYDEQGRVVKLAKPGDDLNSPTLSVDLSNYYNATIANQSFSVNQKGSSTITQWFDGMGRVYQTSETGSGSQCFVQNGLLDSAGRVSQAYVPFLSGSCPSEYVSPPGGTKYTSYGYDQIGRTIVVTNTDGTTQEESYGLLAQPGVEALGVVTDTDANGHGKVSYTNTAGKLAKIEQLKGGSPDFAIYATTVYTYDLTGNMTSVRDAKGNVASLSYDWLGQKLSMSDPDMGSWCYQYDAAGNLTQEVDAKSQAMNFQYDELGRQTKKLEGATPVITYTYDSLSVSNGKGQRTGMQDPSGSTAYSYDSRGNASQEVRTIAGSGIYTTSYSYDSLDRPVATTYPDGEVVTNSYKSWGPLDSMTSSLGDTYLYSVSYNDQKMPTQARYGNSGQLWKTNTYRTDNFRLDSYAVTNTTSSLLN